MPPLSGQTELKTGSRIALRGLSKETIRELRSRGEISCAECRRCRVKCDRKVPCGACTRKKCALLCPNDVLTGTSTEEDQSSEPLMGKIEELQKTISDMTARTQELEQALALTRMSGDLCRMSAGIIHPPEASQSSTVSKDPPQESSSTLENVEYDALIAQIQLKAVGATPATIPEPLFASLVVCLPPRPRAVWLCEIYVDFPWFFRAFTRQEMVDEVFTKVYDNPDRVNHLRRRPHLLAVIYFIFAISATFDRSVPTGNDAARTYFRLGAQCVNLRCLGGSNDLESVQAIALLSQFQSITTEKEQSDGAWFYGSMAVKLATKIGLHRDPSERFPPQVAETRRRVFWEILFQDWLRSMFLGRPASISPAELDTRFPAPEEFPTDENGIVQKDYATCRYMMARELAWPILEANSRAKPMTYSETLALDLRLRTVDVPTKYYPTPGELEFPTPSRRLKEWGLMCFRPICFLFIHRSFFITALMEHPLNPMLSPYNKSLAVTLCCSSFLIRSFAINFGPWIEVFSRYWPRFTHIFGAAVMLGSFAIRSPFLTPEYVLEDLELTVRIYEKAAPLAPRARTALPFLINLQEKARWSVEAALSKVKNAQPNKPPGLIEAANLLQGPSPFPAYSVTPTMPATNAISGIAPNDPADINMEFDFRPYLDNQYFEPSSYDDQAGVGSSIESFLPPQDFEKLFSGLVTPALCPAALMNARDMIQDYPLEFLQLPKEKFEVSPRGVP
ncbi:fungal-specific transcription factor domain-containing protein [Thelephora terrestris]|uniref:Fungal-specific transcription factor domain-containing protein n=1 Tax=Thelephora terrestris TaxID=56493 RepID=A0A9P6L212_9AGAM|nr:fungal-specific transcription factor domain-containing protein [Thelephora terrestris]